MIKVSMKRYFLFCVSLCILGFIFFAIPNHSFADSSENLTGYAWSDNIGWISFNNSSSGDSVPYGVNYDSSTGYMTGFAWSDNIGWIQFGGLSGFPTGSGTTADNAKVDSITGAVTGWARACAGTASGDCTTMNSRTDGWDGWISLSGSNYGVITDPSGSFSGYAWGSDVVGWISFDLKGPALVSAPSNLKSTSTCQGSVANISISFDPVATASSYNLFRCDSDSLLSCSYQSYTFNPPATDVLVNNTNSTYYYSLTTIVNGSPAFESAKSSIIPVSIPACAANPVAVSGFSTNPSTVNEGGKCDFVVNLTSAPDSNAECQITNMSDNSSFTFTPPNPPYNNQPNVTNPLNPISQETKYKLDCWENGSNGTTQPLYSTCYITPKFKEVP